MRVFGPTSVLWHIAYAVALCAVALVSLTSAVSAQDAGGSFLERLLEDSLSSDNQQIKVTGLKGALSSRATIEELAFLDRDGTWMTVTGAVLDWNRTALLRGRFVVNTLRADGIDVLRAPGQPVADPTLPSPETTPFALPDLPVSVEISEIEVGQLTLSEALLGTAATLSANGNLSLVNGVADVKLLVERLDQDRAGAEPDQLNLAAGFSNDTETLSLDLQFTEAKGGLVSKALGLPGEPDLALSLEGQGPLAAFRADLSLDSAGERRLQGSVILEGVGDSSAEGLAFEADLSGNIDPFLDRDFQPFFGPDMRAQLRGQNLPDLLRIDRLVLSTRALQLEGDLSTRNGALDAADLDIAITPPKGDTRVVLPVAGGKTSLSSLNLRLLKPSGADWTLNAAARDVETTSIQIDAVTLKGNGTLPAGQGFALDGTLEAALQGLDLGDPALTRAVGDVVSLKTQISAGATAPDALALTELTLRSGDLDLRGDLSLSGLSKGLSVAADMEFAAETLSRFSDLAGQTLAGALRGDLKARYTVLEGGFDVDLNARGQGLQFGIEDLDPLTAGPSTLRLQAARDQEGLRIEAFDLRTAELRAAAAGTLDSTDGQLQIDAELAEVGRFVPQINGPATVTAELQRQGDRISGSGSLVAARDITLNLLGHVALDGSADLEFDARVPRAERFSPALVGAPLTAKGQVLRKDGQIDGTGTLRAPAGLNLEFEGDFTEATGAANLTYDLVIAQLQALLPGLDGALRSSGQAQRSAQTWQVDGTARGPLGINMTYGGNWAETTARADMVARGSLRLEGANRFIKPRLIDGPLNFDLALRGAPTLNNVSGRISTQGSRLVLPDLAQQIQAINGQIDLAAGRAQVALSASPRDGGQVTIAGPVRIADPFEGDLAIALRDLVLTDKLSYKTTLDGQLRLSGPLATNGRLSGRIDVRETNLNLNTAGGSIAAAPIPPITLNGATAAQAATRARAGLENPAANAARTGASGGALTLDLTINAPKKIFARGRGLNAELGGSIVLRGTTSQLAPSGQISLIRGTFDILGRRLSLDEGQITLLGDLTPYLEFRSSAQTEQGTTTLELSGRTDAPQIQVTSDPPRPSEEALALLLFGDNIGDLSPFALARLATSALTLSGKGGKAQSDLREATGVDSVDIGADNLGAGRLGLGGYLADNVYTDFNVNTEGDSELTINLDLTDTLTATGTVTGEGETGLGLFFKRDY